MDLKLQAILKALVASDFFCTFGFGKKVSFAGLKIFADNIIMGRMKNKATPIIMGEDKKKNSGPIKIIKKKNY